MKKYILITLLLLLNLNTFAALQGNSFTYQGELVDSSGQVLTGNYVFEAQFYDSATAGNIVATNFNIAATVTKGIFTLQLDIGNGSFIGDEVWLELLVTPASGGSQVNLLPRQLITNSPYAIQAQYVGTDGVDTAAIEDSAVTSAKIANGTIVAADIATASVTRIQIAPNTIEKSEIATGGVGTDEIEDGTILAADIDNSSVQQRISNSCPAGESIQSVSNTGVATCISVGASGWGLTGNSGTTPGTNFIGTTDNKALEFKVNNNTVMKIIPMDLFGDTTPNIITGASSNTIATNVVGALIAAGKNNRILSSGSDSNVVISGGYDNLINNASQLVTGSVISGGANNQILNAQSATISGGVNGIVTGSFGVVSGGRSNQATGSKSMVPGGSSNVAGGDGSFAAGISAIVRNPAQSGTANGDEGTFIWSSEPTFFTSTGSKQFLIEASGGVGIGTNAPSSPLHIKGQGTSIGSTTGSNEVVMTIEPKTITDDVAVVINKLDNTKESSLIFSANSQPEFDIRTVNGGAMDFNHFDNSGTPRLMVRINDGTTQRIDMNANLEPWQNGTYNLGGANGVNDYRWATLYTVNVDTTNAVNVTSDKRLKDNINNLKYGLSDILSLRPVSYNMKKGDVKQSHLGLIAQEVETIIPEVVSKKNDEAQTRSMRYSELIPVLIKATQEQQILIEQQNKQINKLKDMLELLMNKHLLN